MCGRGRRSAQRVIARERVVRLLRLADEIHLRDLELAEAYGELARRIAMRTRVRIPREWRWRYCRKCKRLLFPGITATVRVNSRNRCVEIRCGRCGHVNRRPYVREKNASPT
ncbi:MAG: ribonuclease P [Thermoproteota archaeon]|nr:MAG: ribonuclease P [Candidatus Korarchaeota archaeon]